MRSSHIINRLLLVSEQRKKVYRKHHWSKRRVEVRALPLTLSLIQLHRATTKKIRKYNLLELLFRFSLASRLVTSYKNVMIFFQLRGFLKQFKNRLRIFSLSIFCVILLLFLSLHLLMYYPEYRSTSLTSYTHRS